MLHSEAAEPTCESRQVHVRLRDTSNGSLVSDRKRNDRPPPQLVAMPVCSTLLDAVGH
jgi:hypothetical protein